MADPAGKDNNDEAVQILRRLEPALGEMHAELKQLRRDVNRLDNEVGELRSSFVNQESRLSRVEGQVSQLPTWWQTTGLFASVNAITIAFGTVLALLLT